MLQEMIIEDYGLIERMIEQNQKELDEIGDGGQAMRYVGDNPIRRIIHDDKYIYLYQHNYNKYDYFCYTPELYSFLATPSKCSFRQKSSHRITAILLSCQTVTIVLNLDTWYRQTNLWELQDKHFIFIAKR